MTDAPNEDLDGGDGRLRRTARSRTLICEACLDLIQEGELQPSAEQIAERAGLSRRSVFNHFRDLAELYDAVQEAGMQRCAPLLEQVSSNEPLLERIEHLVRAHSAFHEATSAFSRALTAQVLTGNASSQAMRISRSGVRHQHNEVARALAPELASLPARDRGEVEEAAGGLLSPMHWAFLRMNRRLSKPRARAVLVRSLRGLLHDAGAL